jgi:hypothetical protein
LAAAIARATSSDVVVARWQDGAATWELLGAPLDRSIDHAATRPSLAVREGRIAVAWQEHDGSSDNVYAARYDSSGAAWQLWGQALDFDIDAPAVAPSLKLAGDGTPLVAWSDGESATARAYVARWTGGRWEVMGRMSADPAGASKGVALAADDAADPVVVWEEGVSSGAASRLSAKRYNGSPELPFGLPQLHPSPCAFPKDGELGFPETLTQTRCFTDVRARTPAAGLIPYDINSPLWSDGAKKRRFLVLPAATTVGFTDKEAWVMPVGTILVKEFLLEREPGKPQTVFPIETRFLVKRCEPGMCRSSWQGYSYQWDDAGTEARLLTNESDSVFKDWSIAGRVHKHGYPARDECNQCHALAAGGVLGLQTAQFNRNFDYGGVPDNQLRTLSHIGLFGSSFATTPIDALPRFPTPNDASYTTTERVRSYFHSNCSHCHRSDGRWPVVDFRYDTPLVAATEPNANICNELVPGNAEKSNLFIKDTVRESNLPPGFVGKPMPPVATLLPDTRQIPVLKAWIDGMKSCP